MIRGDAMALLKMNLFGKSEFTDSQMALLDLATELGQNTNILRNVKFSIKQLRCLILATKEGIKVDEFANPDISYYTMLLIVQCVKNGLDYSELLEPTLDQTVATAIYYNLTQHLSIKNKYDVDELFEQFEIATGLKRSECQIPIYVEWSQGLSEILFDSRYIHYRNNYMKEGLNREEAGYAAKEKIRLEFS